MSSSAEASEASDSSWYQRFVGYAECDGSHVHTDAVMVSSIDAISMATRVYPFCHRILGTGDPN